MANILVKFNSALTDLISWANLRARHLGWSEESKGLWFKRPLSEAEDDPGEPILIPSTIGQGMGRRYTKTAHGFSVGNAIRYSGGGWVLASAAAFESLATHVVVRVLDANRFDADSSGGWGIGVGISGPVYLSATVPGALTGTRPTTGAVQVVGIGIAGVTWIALAPGDGTFQLDVTKGAPALPGGIGWNADDGAAEINQGGGVVLQIGQETQIPVRNTTGATLLNGKVGILTGSSGERPTATLASAASVATSKAIGVFTQDILNNQIGKMSTFGLVRAIPLDFPEGSEVFLAVATGELSTTPAPGTRVRIGIVVRSHATNGILFVSIDRTPVLAELPDVDLTGAATGHALVKASDGKWKPAAPAPATHAHDYLPIANPEFTGALKQGGTTRITSGGDAWFASMQSTNLLGAGDRPVAADIAGTLQPKTPDQFRNMISALAASLKGAANGVAELGADVKVPVAQLPSAALLALGETPSTAYRGDRGKIAYDHSQIAAGNPHGTTAADVGAMPAPIQITGAIDFNSINGGAPGIYQLEGSSYTNAPGGDTSAADYSLWQGVSGGMTTQVLVDDGWYGSMHHREKRGAYASAWSGWAQIWDSTVVPISLFAKSLLDDADATAARTTLNAAVKPSVNTQAGDWALGTSTPTGTRQTGSGKLFLPDASATYAGLSYTITATTTLTLTIDGTFCYLDAVNSASYWYDVTSGTKAFAMNGGHASGNRKKIEIYCDGAEWLVKC